MEKYTYNGVTWSVNDAVSFEKDGAQIEGVITNFSINPGKEPAAFVFTGENDDTGKAIVTNIFLADLDKMHK